MNYELENVIYKGISYLATQQQKDGSFLSLSTKNRRSFKYARKYHSTFPTSLILSCLSSLTETPKLKVIKQKAVEFLLAQKSKHWSFNYWVRDSKETRAKPYPDDLDDTFCALSALFEYDAGLIDGSAMAKIITLLTAVEEKEGGPYRTWLVPPDSEKVWQDVDLVVNSNVGYFLSLQDVHLSALKRLVESAIDDSDYSSPYYPTEYPVIYFISRWYPTPFHKRKKYRARKGKKVSKVEKFLLSKRDTYGKWDNPLNTALAISSLINLDTSPEKLKKSIVHLRTRQTKGSWKPYAFCIDPAINRKKYYAGSSALTTAFCLEAISKYQETRNKEQGTRSRDQMIGNKKVREKKSKEIENQKRIHEEVVREAKKRFSVLDIDLKKQAVKQLEKTLNSDKDKQIILMPYFFKVSLGKDGESVSDDLLIQLGLANLYGWIAYTIYDDFFDTSTTLSASTSAGSVQATSAALNISEQADTKLLSVANLCLRELSMIFGGVLPQEAGFASFFQKIMDKLDSVNAWEIVHCRLHSARHSEFNSESILKQVQDDKIPDYGDLTKLAEKSIGHALGPVAILFSLGYPKTSLEVKNLMKFFKHFLIARQLNDDAHDWEKDLKMGHVNAVGAEILKRIRNPRKATQRGRQESGIMEKTIRKSKKNPNSSFIIRNSKLQEVFWHEVVVDICDEVLKHVQKARGYIKKVSVVSGVVMFEKILVPIEKSAEKALKEREETLKFLEAYQEGKKSTC